MKFQEKTSARAVRLALGVIAGSVLMHTPALAQSEQPAVQRIEITGSNIKRADKEGSSPIQTITAKEIRESGAATVAELIKTIPAMGGGGAVDALDGGFSKGLATASLRGLGSASTLILLNGRRMTPSAYANPNQGQSTLYDLNSIPLSAIERVEIFKDGASAVYGSDAIAGVINFITKRDYTGAELSASMGFNDNNEFRNKNVNGSYGFGNLSKDGYNVFVSMDLSKRDRTALKDAKDIEIDQYRDMNALLSPYYSFASSSPFFYRERTPGSKSFYSTGATNVINRLDCPTSQQLVGGSQYNILPSSALYGRTFCNYAAGIALQEAQGAGQDVNLLSRGTLALGGDLTAFGEFAYTSSEREYTGPSRTIDGRSRTTAFPQFGAGNPFQAILPVGHPDNPFPNDRAAVVYRFENVAGGSKNTNDSYRALAGLKGTFKDWDWETGLLWNRSDRTEIQKGFLYLPTVQKLITENRTLASLASDPSVYRDLRNKNSAEITQLDAKTSTEFGQLGGGAIGFAMGAEIRQEKMKLTPDALLRDGNILGLVNVFSDAQRTVSSAFAEFRTPFLKNFEMDFAGRLDKYPNLKTNFVPKVGAKWTVAPGLVFRGTYAEGFRAPALVQVAKGGTQFFLNNTVDPVRCPGGTTPLPGADQLDCAKSISGIAGSSPDLKPETSKSFSLGMIYSPTRNFDVLVDLYKIRKESEVALLSATTVLEHAAQYPGLVLRDQNQANWLRDANGNLIPNSGPLFSVYTPYVNQGSTETSGVDIELKLRNKLASYGEVETKLNLGYLISFRRADIPGNIETNLVGTKGGLSNWATSVGDVPRIKAALSNNWTNGPHAVTTSINFVDAVSALRRTDDTVTYPVPYCQYGSGQPSSAYGLGGNAKYTTYYPDCKVPSWTTVDAGYTYTGFKDLSLTLNIRNLFDSRAPYDPGYGSTGYNSILHNPYGRYFTLSANYKFK